jgi:hypothetical protein
MKEFVLKMGESQYVLTMNQNITKEVSNRAYFSTLCQIVLNSLYYI